MATITKQTIYLDLTPGRVFPVLHVSQGDTGLEALEFKLVQNGMVFNIPAAVTDIQINGTTPLGVFSYNHASGVNWSGNTVTAAVTQTMTAEKGMVVAELVLLDSAMHSIGSLNFLLSVEPSPYTVAHVSTSDMASISASLNAAQQNFLMSKSWAVGDTGLRDGEATNNSKYWSEQSAINGERWSVGKINGEDVPSTDETYHNNSKYWAGVAEDEKELAAQYGSGLKAQVDTNSARITQEVNDRSAAVSSEASARQAADTTLQNNINAEANRAKTAENTLQQNISTEAAARSATDSSLQSQINQFVTPSTQQPDEVVNARVGADGTTYSTLGNAIRGQVTDLKSALNEYFDDGLHYYTFGWEQGGINTNTGANSSSDAAIRCDKYIPYEKPMLVTCESGYKFNCFYYDSNKDFITSEQNKQGAWPIEERSNAKWMRVRVVRSAGGNISPSQAPDLKICDMPFNTNKHIVFDTVSDMKQMDFTYPGEIFETRGYYAVGDGGGASYIVSPYSGDLGYTAPHINIQLDNGWYAKLLYTNVLYAKQIGCKSDDQAFDNSVIVNEVTNNSHFADFTLVFEKGVYYFNSGILDTQTVHLIGEYPLNYYSYDKNHDSRLIFTNVIDQTYYSAIYANKHTLISNLFIYGTFVTFAEDRSLIGSTSNPNDSWLTFNVTKADTIGIRVSGAVRPNYNSIIQNCVVRGFSTGIMLHLWSCVRDCLIMECDGYGIISNNDDQIRGCRVQYCGYGIRSGNLAIVSDIRMDSIRYVGVKCHGSNALLSCIHGDYIGQSLVSVDSVSGLVASSIAGRCGINYVNAENNMAENDKRMCALVSLLDTDFVAISAINGRTRQLDDGTLLKNTKAVALNNASEFNISMSGDADGDLTQASFSDIAFIGSDGNVSGGLYINGCLYNLKNANNQYSNIFKPSFVSI